MFDLLNLEELGKRLRQVDRGLVALMGERMSLALQVEEYKRGRRQPIFRPEIEKYRLDEVCEWAYRYGLNPEFARSIFYSIIGESCKMQMIQLQDNTDSPEGLIDEEQWNVTLKKNLLRLTARCATTYDEQYSDNFYATRLHADFERRVIIEACQQYHDADLALDLGCGTGCIAFMLGDYFKNVVGYDISPDMIEVAQNRRTVASGGNFDFESVDLEEKGIPQPDGVASFVVMSMGFASDLRLLPTVLSEVNRVLVSGGTAFISFYNVDALIYQWDFIPWPVGLIGEINLQKKCLEVHWGERETYAIYARPYSVDEVYKLMPAGLSIAKIMTHPTICSILPDTLFSDQRVRDSIASIDGKLADENAGAYITALARKL